MRERRYGAKGERACKPNCKFSVGWIIGILISIWKFFWKSGEEGRWSSGVDWVVSFHISQLTSILTI